MAGNEHAIDWFRLAKHQVDLLRQEIGAVKSIANSVSTPPAVRLSPVLLSACDTTAALIVLGEAGEIGFLSETIMLMRALLEKTINLAYLSICDEDEHRRYFLHAAHRAVSGLHQQFRAGDVTLTLDFKGTIEPSDTVREAQAIFSQPTARWTTSTLGQRLALIAETNPQRAMRMAIPAQLYYADASEGLHGSYYGSLHHLGVFRPGSGVELGTRNDPYLFREHFARSYAMIYLFAGDLLGEAADAMASSDNSVRSNCKYASEIRELAAQALGQALGTPPRPTRTSPPDEGATCTEEP